MYSKPKRDYDRNVGGVVEAKVGGISYSECREIRNISTEKAALI